MAGARTTKAERSALVGRRGGKLRVLRIIAGLTGGVLAVLLTLVAFTPLILSQFAPGFIEDAVSESIDGEVKVDGVQLAWFGEQRVDGFRVVDASGEEVINLDLVSEKTSLDFLVGAAGGDFDMGAVSVGGRVVIELDEEGRPVLARRDDGGAGAPPSGDVGETPPVEEPRDGTRKAPRHDAGGVGEVRLPPTLRAMLAVSDLTIEVIDPREDSFGRVGLESINGDAVFSVRDGIDVDFSTQLTHNGSGAGGVLIDVEIDDLFDSGGAFDVDAMRGTSKVSAVDVSVEVIETLIGDSVERGSLAGSLGPTISASVTVTDSEDAVSALVHLGAEGAGVDGRFDVAFSDGLATVSAPEPFVARVDGSVIDALAPHLRAVVEDPGQGFELGALPEVVVRLEDLSARVRLDGSEPDLGGLGFRATLSLGEVGGRVAEPGGPARDWRVMPTRVSVESDALADGVRLEVSTSAMIGDGSAGSVGVDLAVRGVLDEEGRPVEGVPGEIEGYVLVDGVALSVFEPLLAPLLADTGVELSRVIGPELRAELRAEPSDSRGTTLVRLDVESENLSASGALEVNERRVRSVEPVRAGVASVSPLLGGVLDSRGVELDGEGGIEIAIDDLDVDLVAFGATDLGAEGVPPGSVRGLVRVGVDPIAGRIETGEGRVAGFDTSAFEFVADLRDVDEGATFNAATGWRLDGEPAGRLTLTGSVSGLEAAAQGGLPSVNADLLVEGVSVGAAALFDPELEGLTDALGPTALVDAGVSTDADGAMVVRARFESDGVSARLDAEVGDDGVRSVGDGLDIRVEDVGALSGVFGGDDLPVEVIPGGRFGVRVPEFDVPMREFEPILERASAAFTVTADTIRARGLDGGSVLVVNRFGVMGALRSGGRASVDMTGSASAAGEPMALGGSLEAAGLFDAKGVSPDTMSAVGRIDVTGLPASLVGVVVEPLETGATPVGADVVVCELAGDRFDIAVVLSEADGGTGVVATIDGAQVDGSVRASVGPDAVRLDGAELLVDAPADGVNRVLSLLSDEPDPLRVRSPVAVEFRADAAVLMEGGQLASSGILGAEVVLSVAMDESVGGGVAVEGLSAGVRVPLSAFEDGSSGDAVASIDGRVSDASGADLGTLRGDLRVALRGGTPHGVLGGSLTLEGIDAGAVDAVLSMDNLIAGALGANISLGVEIDGTMTEGEPERIGVSVSPTASRLETARPIGVVLSNDRLELVEPGALVWTMDPVFGTRLLLGQEPGAEQIRFENPSRIEVTLNELSVAVPGDERGVLAPDTFSIDAALRIPELSMLLSDGSRTGLSALTASVRGEGSGPISLDFEGVGAAGRGTGLVADVTVSSFADPLGNPTSDAAVVDAVVSGPAFPTPVVDALARQGGLLTDLLGASIAIDLNAESLSKRSGRLSARAESVRSLASMKGEIDDGVLRSTEPIVVRQSEITEQLGRRLLAGVPILDSIEKRPEDGAAVITITGLRVPTGGDNPIAGLNCDFTADLGRARFSTGEVFGPLLELANQNAGGELGGRISPMTGRVRDGVMTYDRFTLPLGEFEVSSEGTVDLVGRELNVLTRVPLGALASEGLSAIDGVMGSRELRITRAGLDAGSQIPFRATGSLDDPVVELDGELFAREFAGNVIEDVAEELIEKEGRRLFRRLLGGD